MQREIQIAEKRLLDEYITVFEIDSGGQFFKRVSRIFAKNKAEDMEMELDVNFDIYPLEKGGLYRVLILRSLGISLDQDKGKYNSEHSAKQSELDNFQYAMFGRVFKIIKDKEAIKSKISVFVSFGGLILRLSGKTEELDKFGDDQHVYFLMRKA